MFCNVYVKVFVIVDLFMYKQMGLRNMYKSVKHHHDGGIIIFISLWIYLRNELTKVRKTG